MDAESPSFSTFYDIEQPRVHKAVTLILGDPERAARITHEAFVRTHAVWPKAGDDTARPKAGDDPLLSTVRCAFRLAWRARPSDADAVESVTIDLRDNPPARDVDLELALASLPRAQRSVVVLAYFLGLDEDDIATVMSVSDAEVHGHLERARLQLTSLLGEEHSSVS
jgi:DNA-directed RNA polymerase specialized sigma24 family protein